jgi:hypothetical protein
MKELRFFERDSRVATHLTTHHSTVEKRLQTVGCDPYRVRPQLELLEHSLLNATVDRRTGNAEHVFNLSDGVARLGKLERRHCEPPSKIVDQFPFRNFRQ